MFGVVYFPALDVKCWGDKSPAVFKVKDGVEKAISMSPRPVNIADWVVVASRSHQSDEFKAFIEDCPDAELVSIGSSLKLCLLADGKADLYPRLRLASEWDADGPQALIEAAGGQVLAFPEMKPLGCNQ